MRKLISNTLEMFHHPCPGCPREAAGAAADRVLELEKHIETPAMEWLVRHVIRPLCAECPAFSKDAMQWEPSGECILWTQQLISRWPQYGAEIRAEMTYEEYKLVSPYLEIPMIEYLEEDC